MIFRSFCILVFCAIGLQAYANEEEHLFKGRHVLANYTGCDHEALIDFPKLRAAMQEAIEASDATIVGSVEWIFSPEAITIAYLLSESHATIHTYPEHEACFIDIFTCGEKCVPERFDEVMQKYLKPKKVSRQTIERHQDIEMKSSP